MNGGLNWWHDDQFNAFCEAMKDEWLYAREDSFKPFHSLHEGFCVLLEEVHELQEQTFRQVSKRNRYEIIMECVQIATMAFCIIDECVGADAIEVANYRVVE